MSFLWTSSPAQCGYTTCMTPPFAPERNPFVKNSPSRAHHCSGGDNSLCFAGFRIRLSCGLDGTTHYAISSPAQTAHYRKPSPFSLFVVTATVMEDSV